MQDKYKFTTCHCGNEFLYGELMEVKLVDHIITDHFVNEGMNNILFENEEYKRIQKEIDEQHLVADWLISSYMSSGSHCGRLTYGKEFQECVSLLQETRLIGAA